MMMDVLKKIEGKKTQEKSRENRKLMEMRSKKNKTKIETGSFMLLMFRTQETKDSSYTCSQSERKQHSTTASPSHRPH